MKHLTFKQYRTIDLSILCVLTAVFETIATNASNTWFNLQAMTVSITLAITCISFMRWNLYALLPSFVGSFIYCTITGGTTQQYLIYCGGSLFVALAFPILKMLTKEKIRNDFILKLVFVASTYISLILGRWIISLLFEFNVKSLLAFFSADVLSFLFAIIVFAIAKNVEGLIEDQKSYLLRLDKERQEEQNANLNDSF